MAELNRRSGYFQIYKEGYMDLPSVTPEDPTWHEKMTSFLNDWVQKGKDKAADLAGKAHEAIKNYTTLRVRRLTDTAKLPTKTRDGWDIYIDSIIFSGKTFDNVKVRSSFDKNDIPPHTLFKIKCGLKVDCPTNYNAYINHLTDDGVLVSLNTTEDELVLDCIMLSNQTDIELNRGDKIAVLELKPMTDFPLVEECS